jgi:hypothetical protein
VRLKDGGAGRFFGKTKHDLATSDEARRLHATDDDPHRRVALPGRFSGREFQPRPSYALRH